MVGPSTSDIYGLLRVAMVLVGLVLLAYGAALWWEPAGFMVPGAVLIVIALISEASTLRREAPPPVVVRDE